MAQHKRLYGCRASINNYRTTLAGIYPTLFVKKDRDTMPMNKMKDKYDLSRDTKGFLISSINDHIVRFTTKVLATKLLRKMRPNQRTACTIAVVELCVKGVHMNWSYYLLNELLEDVEESLEKVIAFHYSWLLILISFVGWSE